MRRDVFQAIADPTRRQILSVLATHPLNLNAVAGNFDVSRPAVSKHIKILTECGLITITQQGRERYCEAKLEKLNEVSEWVEQYRKFWEDKFDSLENYLQQLQANEKNQRTQATKQQTNTSNKVTKEQSNQETNKHKQPGNKITKQHNRHTIKKQNNGRKK